MSYTGILIELEKLPHYRDLTCKICGHSQKEFILTIQTKCQNCGQEYKLRGLGAIGIEIEDVIDAVLEWIGEGNEFDLAMQRKKLIDVWKKEQE